MEAGPNEGTKACPFCAETIQFAAIKCRFCGSSLIPGVAGAPRTLAVESATVTGTASNLPAIGAVFTILVAAWGAVQAGFAWIAFNEGFTGSIIPIWNSAFDLALVAIAVGVVRRQRWGRDWAIGISALNGIGNAYVAVSHNASLYWIGVVVQGAAAIVLLAARADLWIAGTPISARVSQVLSAVALTGSLVVPFIAGDAGSERGRQAFAEEVQRGYGVLSEVKVSAPGLTMRIDSPTDTDESLGAAADALRAQLKVSGRNAKAWLVGFTAIEMSNGRIVIRIVP